MIDLLHSFRPQPILFSWNGIEIHWYGFCIVLGILAGILMAIKLAKYYRVSSEMVLDLAFWLVLGGIIGARLYHVGLQYEYYLKSPVDILKIWQGGLAIHGAIIAGILIIFLFARFASGLSANFKKNFWLLTSIVAPALALAQAIGRWGNYFNQELLGRPTDLPWGIPINLINRPLNFLNFEYFHPTFLYESLGNILIFLILIGLHIWIIKKQKTSWEIIVAAYLILYSILRFGMEFLRIDETPMVFGLRLPQVASLILIVLALLLTIPPIKR